MAAAASVAAVLLWGAGASSGRTPASAIQAAPAPAAPTPAAPAPIAIRDATVVARFPHDAGAFSQGLIWHAGHLYESTGQPGRSEVRRVRLADGTVLARQRIAPDQFGEGLAAVGDSLFSLTWTSGVAYRWDARTLRRLGSFRYPGQGWGLASDGRRLILSDGTPTLRFLDPASFRETGRITVTANGRPLRDLNELEVIDGALYGNVWHRSYLVRIDLATGAVTEAIDLSPIVAEVAAADPEAVLNGIAWNPKARRLFITGKLWPTLFEVKLGAVRR